MFGGERRQVDLQRLRPRLPLRPRHRIIAQLPRPLGQCLRLLQHLFGRHQRLDRQLALFEDPQPARLDQRLRTPDFELRGRQQGRLEPREVFPVPLDPRLERLGDLVQVRARRFVLDQLRRFEALEVLVLHLLWRNHPMFHIVVERIQYDQRGVGRDDRVLLRHRHDLVAVALVVQPQLRDLRLRPQSFRPRRFRALRRADHNGLSVRHLVAEAEREHQFRGLALEDTGQRKRARVHRRPGFRVDGAQPVSAALDPEKGEALPAHPRRRRPSIDLGQVQVRPAGRPRHRSEKGVVGRRRTIHRQHRHRARFDRPAAEGRQTIAHQHDLIQTIGAQVQRPQTRAPIRNNRLQGRAQLRPIAALHHEPLRSLHPVAGSLSATPRVPRRD